MAAERMTWAILGAGPIAVAFLQGLAPMGDRAAVVASRRPERAQALAARHRLRAASYEDAVHDPSVQAIYIATPPALHEEHARLAIAAGKAVLIEKPFALDEAAAARIRAGARAAGVFCMEAMWTRFQPLLGAIRARIDAGELGEIRQFEGAFCGADRPDPALSLFDPARGGGALMHRGVYALSLARYLLGPVSDLHARARIGVTGVDEDCVLSLRHASGALSVVRASLSSNGPNGMIIQGSAGTLRVEPPIYRPLGARLYTTRPREGGAGGSAGGLRGSALAHRAFQRLGPALRGLRPGGTALRAPYAGNGYGHQVAAVEAALAEGRTESPFMPLDESVEIMGLIDAARAQWSAR